MSEVPEHVLTAIARHLTKKAQEEPPQEQKPDSSPLVPHVSIATLNRLFNSELEAIHEYTGHYAVALSMGYTKLAAALLERLNDERKHADMLAYRIVFLGGSIVVDAPITAGCGTEVEQMHRMDLAKEQGASKDYNEAVEEARTAKDNVSRMMLESILKDEDDHIDENSTELDKICRMGLQQYLVTQV